MIAATQKSALILVVDHDPATRSERVRTLGAGGHQTLAVADARSAVEALERFHPEAVVLADLPEGAAFAFLNSLPEECPVLFIAPHNLPEEDLVRAFNLGAWDCLRTPFGSAEFLARMQGALKRHGRVQELVRLGSTDELTGLANRRAFHEALERERRRAHRDGSELSLIELDIDRFKLVNDTHGHAAGDLTLRAIGRVLRTQTRSTDIAGRVGGEEFALILPSTGGAGATDLAEKLRTEIASVRIELFDGLSIRVTASFGIATLSGEALAGAEASAGLLALADAALYRAKRAGRDRVEVSELPSAH